MSAKQTVTEGASIAITAIKIEEETGVRKFYLDPKEVCAVLRKHPDAKAVILDRQGREVREVSAAFLRGYLFLDCKSHPESQDIFRPE